MTDLCDTRFFKSTFNFRRCANGPMESAPMYTYESGRKLYDVIVLDGKRHYRVNGGPSSCTRYHKAVEEHFNLES